MKLRMMIAVAGTLGLSLSAVAAGEPASTLTIGDDAPAISISHWIKGEPVGHFERGKIYVMEFWATWCGPCRSSMPHISGIQERYADYVQVVSVSDEPLAKVVDFLVSDDGDGSPWFDKMAYTVATDPDGSVKDAYMKAAGQNGIPTAFIVGRTGQIEWIGHPMAMDAPLKAIVDDEWDRDAFGKKFSLKQRAKRKVDRLLQGLAEARAQGDTQKAIKFVEGLIGLGEQYEGYQTLKFELLVSDRESSHAGYTYGIELAKANWDDPQVLNVMAWFIVDDEDLQNRDFDFALKIAERACGLTNFANAGILDTYARVFYERGEMEAALRWQRQAVEYATEGPLADGVRATLDQYEREADQD